MLIILIRDRMIGEGGEERGRWGRERGRGSKYGGKDWSYAAPS